MLRYLLFPPIKNPLQTGSFVNLLYRTQVPGHFHSVLQLRLSSLLFIFPVKYTRKWDTVRDPILVNIIGYIKSKLVYYILNDQSRMSILFLSFQTSLNSWNGFGCADHSPSHPRGGSTSRGVGSVPIKEKRGEPRTHQGCVWELISPREPPEDGERV